MIRHLIILTIFFPLLSFSQTNYTDKQIDSFLKKEFNFLDNRLKFYSTANPDSIGLSEKDFQSTLDRETNTIEFFERLTGIKAETHHHYAYAKDLKQSTVESWKKWTEKNKILITWDNVKNKVNRTDRDIYSTDLRTND
jgi:hypothetical protein